MEEKDLWKYALIIAITVALLAHVFFPRYEWRSTGDSTLTIVIHDRWTGRFQRAIFDDKGALSVTTVFTPF